MGVADLAAEDSWSWALRAFRAAAEAEGSEDAFIEAGRVLQRLDAAALLDIAVTMAVVPVGALGRERWRGQLDRLTGLVAMWERRGAS